MYSGSTVQSKKRGEKAVGKRFQVFYVIRVKLKNEDIRGTC